MPDPIPYDQHESEMTKMIVQRDDAEEALSQAYYLVMGRSAEWSNLFGYAEAIEEIDDAQTMLREALKKAESERDKLRYAAQLAADWINNDFIDVTDNEDGTSTIDDSEIETAHAKGDAIKQALLDALN